MKQTTEILVFIATHDVTCGECGEELGRHAETDYDALLAQGHDRWEARAAVEGAVNRMLARWEG